MYRTCIFCAADLGENETIEAFPVGGRLAFDAEKGRLWAVCPRCRRWNLAPIEERWEAVEEAERAFRGSRTRAQSENVGLARLPEGGSLVRIGRALPRELAAWRYGDELLRRYRRTAVWGGVALGTGGVIATGAVAAAGLVVLPIVLHLAIVLGSTAPAIAQLRQFRSVLHRPGGGGLVIRLEDMVTARVVPAEREGVLAVQLHGKGARRRVEEGGTVRWLPPEPVRLEGADAEQVLVRALARANARGARLPEVDRALDRLGGPEGREPFLRAVAERGGGLFSQMVNSNSNSGIPDLRGGLRRFAGTFRGERIAGGTLPLPPPQLPAADRLALEMALHEDSERRALEGELAQLEAAWREAEEIAAIADVLPDDPLERLER